MPSPNEFVTSANAKTSLYITRTEVIEAISSIIPALSTFSSITFGVSPNPLFSTIAMNPSGQITGFIPVQSSNVIFQNAGTFNTFNSLRIGAYQGQAAKSVAPADNLGNAAPITCSGVEVRTNSIGSTLLSQGMGIVNDGITFVAGGYTAPVYALQPNFNTSNVALTNISSINGSPPNTNPTTYTNLSGQNITNTGVITTPSMVSLSSLNGVPLSSYLNSQAWVPYNVTVTTPASQLMVANQLYTVLTFTGLPITAGLGKFVNISVPILVSPTSGSLGAPVNITLYAQIGGNITSSTQGVGASVQLTPGSANTSRLVTLSGVVSVNGPNPTLQIQAVIDTGANITFQQGSYNTKFFFQQVV